MAFSNDWQQRIEAACEEPDPARSNQRITAVHHELSEALANALGRDAGPNFHSWAVWGSRKAGVTIRQEDLSSAIQNATRVAGMTGAMVGVASGLLAGKAFGWNSSLLTGAAGCVIGAWAGSQTGKQIALWSRARAAQLVLEGNRTVLRDIGEQSARFLALLQQGAPAAAREAFFAGLRRGPSESHGQDRLATAFHHYLAALDARSLEEKRERMIAGNCEIVYHEHIRLEPYIRGAMPFIVRRCATQRLMTYEIGERTLTVGENLPGVETPTAAQNWTRIEQRMRYVFALFRKFHDAPEVMSAP